jgi:hypothetical protein
VGVPFGDSKLYTKPAKLVDVFVATGQWQDEHYSHTERQAASAFPVFSTSKSLERRSASASIP